MKTYKELIDKDYKYLNELRYDIAKNANKENDIIYPVVFNSNLVVTADNYYIKKLDMYTTIINILVKHHTVNESDLHNFYVRETVIEYKKKMIDCIDECLSDISTDLDKEKNHG